MSKLVIYILLFVFAFAYARADIPDAVYLNKDQKSPYSGYLLPQEKLVELKNNTLERDSLKLQNDSLNTSLKLQDDIISKKSQQVQLYSDQNDKLAKSLQEQQSLSTLERIVWFGIGIVVTGLAVEGVHQIYK